MVYPGSQNDPENEVSYLPLLAFVAAFIVALLVGGHP